MSISVYGCHVLFEGLLPDLRGPWRGQEGGIETLYEPVYLEPHMPADLLPRKMLVQGSFKSAAPPPHFAIGRITVSSQPGAPDPGATGLIVPVIVQFVQRPRRGTDQIVHVTSEIVQVLEDNRREPGAMHVLRALHENPWCVPPMFLPEQPKPAPREPLTLDGLKALLGPLNEGASLPKVKYNSEGGFRVLEN